MKNIPIIVSIVALALSIIAIVGSMNNKTPDGSSSPAENTNPLDYKIAYVNLDTLVDAYDYYNEEKTKLLKWQTEKETDLDSRYKALQRKALEIQKKVQDRMMTPTTAQKRGEQLAFQEQQIMQDKQTFEYESMEKNQKLTLAVFDSIKTYLRVYNKDKNYKLILSNDTLGTTILLGGSKMNITPDIIKGLNDRYRSANPDSTLKPEDSTVTDTE